MPRASRKPLVAPAIVPAVKYNKVNDVMPPMRRTNLLMLEFESYEAALQNGSLYGKPLPPITSNSEGHLNEAHKRAPHTAPARSNPVESDPCVDAEEHQRRHSVGQDQFYYGAENKPIPVDSERIQISAGEESAGGSDGVFLTQVNLVATHDRAGEGSVLLTFHVITHLSSQI